MHVDFSSYGNQIFYKFLLCFQVNVQWKINFVYVYFSSYSNRVSLWVLILICKLIYNRRKHLVCVNFLNYTKRVFQCVKWVLFHCKTKLTHLFVEIINESPCRFQVAQSKWDTNIMQKKGEWLKIFLYRETLGQRAYFQQGEYFLKDWIFFKINWFLKNEYFLIIDYFSIKIDLF